MQSHHRADRVMCDMLASAGQQPRQAKSCAVRWCSEATCAEHTPAATAWQTLGPPHTFNNMCVQHPILHTLAWCHHAACLVFLRDSAIPKLLAASRGHRYAATAGIIGDQTGLRPVRYALLDPDLQSQTCSACMTHRLYTESSNTSKQATGHRLLNSLSHQGLWVRHSTDTLLDMIQRSF
jgi:hypothetical protein